MTVKLNDQTGDIDAGGSGEDGDLRLKSSSGETTIHLDGDNAQLQAGGGGTDGSILLKSRDGSSRVAINSPFPGITIGGSGGRGNLWLVPSDSFQFGGLTATVSLDADSASIVAGGRGTDGQLELRGKDGGGRIEARAEQGEVFVGGNGARGGLFVRPPSTGAAVSTDASIRLHGNSGTMAAGGVDTSGRLVLEDRDGRTRLDARAKGADVHVGGNGANGDIRVYPSAGENGAFAQSTIHLNGASADIVAGGNGAHGSIVLQDDDGKDRIKLDTATGNINVGGNGADGDLLLYPASATRFEDEQATLWVDADRGNMMLGGKDADGDIALFPKDAKRTATDWSEATIWLNGEEGNLMLGGNGHDGDIALFPSTATISQSNFDAATIHLDGDRGDIILRNADCAEEFTILEGVDAEPGMVMVLAESGELVPCSQPYDTRAVGVMSGAGQYKPGIVLDRQESDERRLPIALMGKVSVLATDENGPIRVGDLLTTASVTGHAMKAEPGERAFGAVVGKALTGLESGTGLVNIVVALQ